MDRTKRSKRTRLEVGIGMGVLDLGQNLFKARAVRIDRKRIAIKELILLGDFNFVETAFPMTL